MFAVASALFQSTRPAVVTSTAHACRGGVGPQPPPTGVAWALAWAGVAAGPAWACWAGTLPQAARAMTELAASRMRALSNAMTMGRRRVGTRSGHGRHVLITLLKADTPADRPRGVGDGP